MTERFTQQDACRVGRSLTGPKADCVMQWSAETNASITAIFFRWLVGPLETKEVDVEFEGQTRIWRSGVQIKKCRYLEQSGCVGMCINMCKVWLPGTV